MMSSSVLVERTTASPSPLNVSSMSPLALRRVTVPFASVPYGPAGLPYVHVLRTILPSGSSYPQPGELLCGSSFSTPPLNPGSFAPLGVSARTIVRLCPPALLVDAKSVEPFDSATMG